MLREQIAAMRAQLGEAYRLAESAPSTAEVLRRSRAQREPDPGRGGEIQRILDEYPRSEGAEEARRLLGRVGS